MRKFEKDKIRTSGAEFVCPTCFWLVDKVDAMLHNE